MAPSYIDSKGNLRDKAPWHHQLLVFVQEVGLALWLFFSTLINVGPVRCPCPGLVVRVPIEEGERALQGRHS
ncbi:BQ2448_455 [Microbotryum intermedium]|uniref:BQ2448_455 protein n=1 Tax=Microbotryum intermedium TaxID=269621 RepID=A0A238F8X8_9BASI|nr:BQ2448_455 [Microbotryum intermedium]